VCSLLTVFDIRQIAGEDVLYELLDILLTKLANEKECRLAVRLLSHFRHVSCDRPMWLTVCARPTGSREDVLGYALCHDQASRAA
jgi:hypothetical protein